MNDAITRYEFDGNKIPKNVNDEFMNMTTEQIREAMDLGRSSMVTVLFNLTNDFNKASAIRAHSAFLGNDVYLVGKRRLDRRGTVGAHHYNDIYHTPDFDILYDLLRSEGYAIWAVDNTPELNPQTVAKADFPEKVAFIYGEETNGVPFEVAQKCDGVLYIPQPGAMPRSINVSQAAAVIMYEYNRRFGA